MGNYFVNIVSNYYMAIGDIDRAKELLYASIKSDPENLPLLNKLKEILYSNGNIDEFIHFLKEVELLRPNSYLLKRSIGSFLVLLSKFDDAIPYLKFCIENRPIDSNEHAKANAHARLGICYVFLGRISDAEKELTYAESISPWDIDVCFGLLQYFKSANLHDKILGFLDDKISKYPNLYPLYFWKADYIAYYHNDLERAIEWYKLAVRFMWKGHFQHYSRLYLSVDGSAFPENVLKSYFETLIKTRKKCEAWKEIFLTKLFLWDKVDIGLLRIQYRILIKEFYLAERQCLTVTRIKKQKQYLSVVYSYLSVAQLGLGKIGDSISNAKYAVTLNKYNYDAWESLANGLKASEKWEDAIRTLDEMINMDPQNSDWLENLGLCYMNIGDYQNAKKYLMMSLSYDPFDYVAWNTLGDIYQQLNATESAQDAYEKSQRYKQIIGK